MTAGRDRHFDSCTLSSKPLNVAAILPAPLISIEVSVEVPSGH